MHGEWAGGKGSSYRKLKNPNQFYENWDNIFSDQKSEEPKEKKEDQ